jgi:hypothetical protein
MWVRYDWLDQKVRVVNTLVGHDLALHAAQMLLSMIRNRAAFLKGRDTIRVGVSGGGLVQRACGHLAWMLARSWEGLPAQIVFHNIVSSLDIDASKDSTNISALFGAYSELKGRVGFVGLPAPGFVLKGQYQVLKNMPGIKKVFDYANKFDIIFSSSGHWLENPLDGKQHSLLAQFLQEEHPSVFNGFLEAHCRGDFIFNPLGPSGLLDFPGESRIMSLLNEPGDLSSWVSDGTEVLAVVGPCVACSAPKTEVLRTLLDLPKNRKIVTHLVTHVRAVQELLLGSFQPRLATS